MKTRWIGFALAVSLIAGCASTGGNANGTLQKEETSAAAPEGAGLSREAALEVCKPGGERAYLDRLRCANGSAPSYDRLGSVGPRNPATEADGDEMLEQIDPDRPLPAGQTDFHTLDLYEVVCPGRTYQIFMDMYHCHQPTPDLAPPGLTLVSDDGPRA